MTEEQPKDPSFGRQVMANLTEVASTSYQTMVPPDEDSALAPPGADVHSEDFYLAPNWKLVWWRFKKHRLAVISSVVRPPMIRRESVSRPMRSVPSQWAALGGSSDTPVVMVGS